MKKPESIGPRSFFQRSFPSMSKQNKPSERIMATIRVPSVTGVALQWVELRCRRPCALRDAARLRSAVLWPIGTDAEERRGKQCYDREIPCPQEEIIHVRERRNYDLTENSAMSSRARDVFTRLKQQADAISI